LSGELHQTPPDIHLVVDLDPLGVAPDHGLIYQTLASLRLIYQTLASRRE
jgi:hypothetical protein